MESYINLIVGLGNYGADYENTRHNAGYWFVQSLAKQYNLTFRFESKFKGWVSALVFNQKDHWLLLPKTYMNRSGESVKALVDFYKLSPESILVVHDELDFLPGTIRLKYEGGHAGHNGLKSIINHLHTNDFYRLRLGIGRPLLAEEVSDYVLSAPSKTEHEKIRLAINRGIEIIPTILAGEIAQATQLLHT